MPDHIPILEAGGEPTGATFDVERIDGVTTVRYDSRGTTAGTRAYRRGVVLLLMRLQHAGATITDLCIETRTTASLGRDERRIPLGPPRSYPWRVDVDDDASADAVRATIHTGAARAGRAPGARGGGNGTKRLRFYLRARQGWPMNRLREHISRGA